MSRVGKMPIIIPPTVKVEYNNLNISITGPKGKLQKEFFGDIEFKLEEDKFIVFPTSNTKTGKSMWGTARSIIHGMVKGVSEGFKTELEVNGVGYRASVKDSYLNLALGKSHNTKMEIPQGIKVEAPKQNSIILECMDKQKLGQFVSVIIKQRPPEPYKGKGIKRKDQYVQRKENKKNK